MSGHTRKKTNTSEITEEEGIIVRDKPATLRDSMSQVRVQGGARSTTQEVMEEYMAQLRIGN